MKWTLAACLVAMTACAADDPLEPGSDSDSDVIHRIDCTPAMYVGGAGPYTVQCAAAYSVSEAGMQIEYVATDANNQAWVSARAAAPQSPHDDGVTIFAVQSATAPALGDLMVSAKLVDAAQAPMSSDISATIEVRY